MQYVAVIIHKDSVRHNNFMVVYNKHMLFLNQSRRTISDDYLNQVLYTISVAACTTFYFLWLLQHTF